MLYASPVDYSLRFYNPHCDVSFWPDVIDGRKLLTTARLKSMRTWVDKTLNYDGVLTEKEQERLFCVIHLLRRIVDIEYEAEEVPELYRSAVERGLSGKQPEMRGRTSVSDRRKDKKRDRYGSGASHLRGQTTLGFDEQFDLPVDPGSRLVPSIPG